VFPNANREFAALSREICLSISFHLQRVSSGLVTNYRSGQDRNAILPALRT